MNFKPITVKQKQTGGRTDLKDIVHISTISKVYSGDLKTL